MSDPNFLLIGAQKCGTSWLSSMLKQHPSIMAPEKKELHFFNNNYHLGMDWYRQQFPEATATQRIGEFTPNYFWTSDDPNGESPSHSHFRVPERVRKHYPGMKLIVILKDPVARAVSAYYHHIRDRTLSPLKSLYESRDHRGILSMGFYDTHLTNWLAYFPREQFHVMFFEEAILGDKLSALRGVCDFLDVDPGFPFAGTDNRFNTRSSHLNLILNYFAPEFTKRYFWKLRPLERFEWPRIKVDEKDIEALREIYKPHNRRLSEILGNHLPWD